MFYLSVFKVYLPTIPWPSAQQPIQIFYWAGTYAGFILDNWLFAPNGRYLGWRDGQDGILKSDGTHLGQLIDGNYILRRINATQPVKKTPKVPPVPPMPPRFPGSRIAKIPKPGWLDPLVDLLRMPTHMELAGGWRLHDGTLSLCDAGTFTWSILPATETLGLWRLQGEHILISQDADDSSSKDTIYQIVEFSEDAMVWRWQTQAGRSLPFKLWRVLA